MNSFTASVPPNWPKGSALRLHQKSLGGILDKTDFFWCYVKKKITI